MPVHDWTRIVSGIFHDFHQRWIVEISRALNDGILPDGFYSLSDQVAQKRRPDVVTLETADEIWRSAGSESGTALAVAEHPPQVEFTEEMEREIYARTADRVAIYHVSGDVVVAYIEVVSPGNKHSDHELGEFFKKLDEALERECHLLVVDVLPPTRQTPRGIHAAFWEHRCGEGQSVTADRPFGLAAYQVRSIGENATGPKAWFQPVGLNEPLPDMPLFLSPSHYVNVPLEATYMAAWRGVPQRWKAVVEGQT